MRVLKKSTLAILLLSSTLMLASCESLEERAEGHYQSALALIAEGDVDRAIVELRNAYDLDGSHIGARTTMAEIQLERGNRRGAYRQYLRLAETYPEDVDSRIILSELAFQSLEWEEFERHGATVAELAPDNPRVQAISLVRQYRAAMLEKDNQTRNILGNQAQQTLASLPDNVLLHATVLDNALRNQNFDLALEEIAWMIAYEPDNSTHYQERLRVYATLEDTEALEQQMIELVSLFPENPVHLETLLRYYVSTDNLDAAENALREQVASFGAEKPETILNLLTFLNEFRDEEAVRKELEAAIANSADPLQFRILDANFDFALGMRTEAIETLRDVLTLSETDETTHNVKVRLAQMLLATGNEVGARAHVEEVLAADETHAEALKMRAVWQVEADEVNDAISNLRTALDQNPRDAQAMTLIADAYTRAGRTELARDFLAQSVPASGNAPAETLRYARVLAGDENFTAAEDILLTALRVTPNNIDIVIALGEIYMRMENFDRVRGVIAALERVDDEKATQASIRLETERLNRQEGVESALSYLETLASGTDSTLAIEIDLVRAKIGVGQIEDALALAQTLKNENPDNVELSLLLANAQIANGNADAGKDIYRTLLDEDPTRAKLWLELSALESRAGNRDIAEALVLEGLEHSPNSPDLLWGKASFVERAGDVDGAIEIYEQLYAQNSNSVLIANNLSSHLSSSRQDEESLERAWVIAQRLRNTTVPAFKDTYGWILHRRGDNKEALTYLEDAAQQIPNDPVVRYHLAKVYAALDRNADAIDQLSLAIEMANPSDTRSQIIEARSLLETLSAAPTTATE